MWPDLARLRNISPPIQQLSSEKFRNPRISEFPGYSERPGNIWQGAERFGKIANIRRDLSRSARPTNSEIPEFRNYGIYERFGKTCQHLTGHVEILGYWEGATRSHKTRTSVEFRHSGIQKPRNFGIAELPGDSRRPGVVLRESAIYGEVVEI